MNKRDKFLAFLDHVESEGYLPFHPILMHFAARFNGNTYGEFASDHHVLVQSNIRALEEFEADWVELISDPYRETAAFGAKIEFIPEGVPRCIAPIIKTMEDVRALKNPNLLQSARTLDRIRGAELYNQLLKGTVPVFGWIEGPLAEACDLVGVSEMLMMLMIDSDFSNLLMDKCLITAKAFAKLQIDAGCDVIGIGDAICSQIDLDLYDVYVKERHADLISDIHQSGGKVKMHICGKITHLLPSLKDLGIDILDIDSQVNFEEAHDLMGPKVAICGNINPVLIQNLEADEISRLTADLVRSEIGKKFILSGGCEITVNTPHRNLRALRSYSL
ncbi:MAG: uroporphyrinogen decarboxylase family protein [Prolixibacteraceae bacterium]